MRGYIFEYYKYVRYTKKSLSDLDSVLQRKLAENSILTFGEYDRLRINIVENFARYRDLSELARTWLGKRQSVYLYEIEENPKYMFDYDENSRGCWYQYAEDGRQKKDESQDEHLFWAMTELPFMSDVRADENSYNEILKSKISDLRKAISEKASESGYNIEYEIFGTLGTFGIVILWFGNQFTEILNFVNAIKMKMEGTFLTARTLFSKNPMYDNVMEKDHALIDAIEGKAYVQITVKNHLKEDDKYSFLSEMHGIEVRHTPGEYDVVLEMPAKDAFTMFEQEKIFDHDQDIYQEDILQTKVTFAKEMTFAEGSPLNQPDKNKLPEDSNNTMVRYLKDFNELCEEVRKKLRDKMPKTSGLVDTLDSLISDYSSNVLSAVNENWAEDFAYTFHKNLECINEVLDIKEADGSALYILRLIMNNLKQQIFHITEANSLNLENPKCHLRYTGQEDGLLFCYMGMIKEILETAYQLDSCNMQSEIVPIVTVDVVPIIESELYFDESTFVNERKNEWDKDQEFKILSLNLPHVAFYEIPVYFQYMYHEIFHYIVPKDREERDYTLGTILTTMIVNKILADCFDSLFINAEKVQSITDCILPLIYNSVTGRYNEIHEQVTVLDKKVKDRDVVLFIADVYLEKIVINLLNIKEGCFLDKCIKDIGNELNDDSSNINYRKIQTLISDEKMIQQTMEMFNEGITNSYVSFIVKCNMNIYKADACRFLDGMKEVSADIPMIELSDMPLVEYLIFYANCLKNKLVKPDELRLDTEFKECLRVAMILKYYNVSKLTNEDRDEFVNKFVGKYLIVSQSDEADAYKLIQKLKDEAYKWLGFYKRCIKYKNVEFAIFDDLFARYIDAASVKRRLKADHNIREKCKLYFNNTRKAFEEYSDKLGKLCIFSPDKLRGHLYERYREIKKPYEEVLFVENIKLFQHFQIQKSLNEINGIREEKNEQKVKRSSIFIENFERGWVIKNFSDRMLMPKAYVINSFVSLASELERIIGELRVSADAILGSSDVKVWYRGQKNWEYGLIPSIMRESTSNKKKFHYIAQYQRYEYGEFKFRADGAPEMKEGYNFGMSDYLALMQHYHVYTNLMDWSEDAFTAMYFALEDVMLDRSAQETNAALWIFSPQLYNDARKFMIEHEARTEPCTEAAFRNSLNTVAGYDGMIPNISVEQNEKIYDMFLLGNADYESPNRYGYRKRITLSGHEEMAYLPLAVYTSRLNPRVRSQSGIFVAYNLYAEPSIECEYAYMGLEKVQEYYLKNCKRDNKRPFLYKIIIDRDSAKDIARCLESVGINRSRIYPELSNAGERVK